MDLLQLPHIRVTLNYEEETLAHHAGFARAQGIRGKADHATRKDTTLNFHQYVGQLAEAVGSEMCVAKYFGLTDFKPTINTFKREADVGARLEVKHTLWRDGHLIVHQSDRADDIAVLVVGRSPEYYLVGWIPVIDAKVKRFYVESEKNWWVRQHDLRPMTDFLRSKYARTSF
jgi:hypothetical protein